VKGGVSRAVTLLSKALGESDVRVTVVSADPGAQPEIAALQADRLPPGLEFCTPGRTYQHIRHLAQASNGEPLLVHDNGLWLPSNLMSAAAARRWRVPLIVSPHGMLEPWCLAHRRIRKQLALATYQRWSLGVAHALHATSEDESTNVRRLGLQQPIAVVGNGIESPPEGITAADNARRIALFLSRLHPIKGVLELVEAWRRVRPIGWLLRIVGPDDGGHRRAVEAAIARSGLGDGIELRDAVSHSEKWLHYAQAELFVLPSFSESFGLVVGEALSCGVPVITTTATPWASITTRGCGWLIEPDVGALETALGAATTLSTDALRAMGARGRDWVRQEFSWEEIGRQMRTFYRWVALGCSRAERPDFVRLG
jgi:glycosyltransferase involved in cell wall biosynthesis